MKAGVDNLTSQFILCRFLFQNLPQSIDLRGPPRFESWSALAQTLGLLSCVFRARFSYKNFLLFSEYTFIQVLRSKLVVVV